jgi:Na+-transporting NADH:ubiquinone oxidoreductase subunit A
MKFVGGYDVQLEGQPSTSLAKQADPEVLHIPLFSRSFNFSNLLVEAGTTVTPGQVLAEDPDNFSVVLLAPVGGTVNLEAAEYHVTLENLSGSVGDAIEKIDSGDARQNLLRLGVWSFMKQLGSGRVPDPTAAPDTLIIPICRFEPFYPSPEVVLKGRLEEFGSGLARLHEALLKPQIHLVVPEGAAGVAAQLDELASGNSDWLNLFEVPENYPFENPALVAQLLELDPDTVWSMDAQAVLGAEQALGKNIPYTTRIISIGGPAATEPCHTRVMTGYPLSLLVTAPDEGVYLRLIDGGTLTGKAIGGGQRGFDAECVALNVLQENTEREVLAFVQAGFAKQSYSKTFASIFKPLFKENMNTALRGESRPCVFCGYCEDVCPAGIIPHLVYRYLDNDRSEDAYRVGLDQCVECGLCSYVCLSKINHLDFFQAEKAKYAEESVE